MATSVETNVTIDSIIVRQAVDPELDRDVEVARPSSQLVTRPSSVSGPAAASRPSETRNASPMPADDRHVRRAP